MTASFPGQAKQYLFTSLSFLALLCCSPAKFSGQLKKDFRLFHRVLPIITGLSNVPVKEHRTKLCGMNLSARENLAQKIISDPSHSF